MEVQNQVDQEAEENNRDKIPTYKLSRHLESIEAVWREWKHGLAGGPAVETLERRFGTSWRKDRTESKYFSRGKAIYDEIKRVQENERLNEVQAIQHTT